MKVVAPDTFIARFNAAMTGDSIVYFTGLYGDAARLPAGSHDKAAAMSAFNVAWGLYDSGRANLLQRRIGAFPEFKRTGAFEYIAQKCAGRPS